MIKRTYGAHPLMILKFMKPFLFVLVLPVIKGAIQYLITRKITGVILLETVAVLAVGFLSFLSFKAFSISVNDKIMVIKQGLLLKKESVIERNRLSSVTALIGPFDLLFRSVTYKINTEAGISGRTDFSFKLTKSDADELFLFLYGKENRTALKFPASKTAIFAAASSSALTGIVVGVPIINNLGKLLGIALNRILFDEISRASSRFNAYFPPIVNIITALVLVSYAISFMVTFVKMLNFRLRAGEEKLEAEYGLFCRRHIIFKKSAVNDVCIEQTPLLRLFGLYSMRAAVGGYGDKRGEKAIIVPAASRFQIKTQMGVHFPFLHPKVKGIIADRFATTKMRFLWPAELYAIIDITLTVLLSLFFRSVFLLFSVSGAAVLAVIVYYASVCYRNYCFGEFVLGDCVFASGSIGLSVRELYCEKDRVGEIELKRTPLDRRKNTCKAQIIICSESADSVRVKNIDYKKTLEMIEICYSVSE